jgi:uncharacterized protein YndB with AHSA1/START domain
MRSPAGEDFPNVGCYLEVVPNERLVWTSALAPGYRPLVPQADGLPFTAVISLEPTPTGTRYRALAIHPDADTCRRHDEMGFPSTMAGAQRSRSSSTWSSTQPLRGRRGPLVRS